jgi:hypothetical protein
VTPEKLKQRRRDCMRRAREKAAAEVTAKWLKENYGELIPMSLSPLMTLSAVLGGIALAGVIIVLVEYGVI